MRPSPNAKPVSQDLDRAFSLFWGIVSLDRRFEKAKFPTRDTTPTEKECRAALARILTGDKIPARVLRELAAAIYPEGNYTYGTSRRIKFEKINQGHRDAHRDFIIAEEVAAAMKQNTSTSRDEACIAVAKLAGLSFERVRDIYQEQKAFDQKANSIIAAAVQAGMSKGESCDEACIEVAKLAGMRFELVRDIYQEQKALPDTREKARTGPGIRKRSAARIR
jgi:hypothetical protein